MINLYDELLEVLTDHEKTINDIEYIGVCESCTESYGLYIEIEKSNFIDVAKKTNYDNGYGGVEIPPSLVIVGENWWLERRNYDGSEWFEYRTAPQRPLIIKYINKLNIDWRKGLI